MISEVANALFATYLYSEYLLRDQHDVFSTAPRSSAAAPSGATRLVPRPFTVVAALLVVVVNVLDRVTGAVHTVNRLVERALHVPKISVAAVAYVLALYLDVTRRLPPDYRRSFSVSTFFKRVGLAFLRVLPAYPFLAVLISFVFMFVVNLWEALRLPIEWLNAPIYFGTLYGPFAWVYINVKTRLVNEHLSLPA